MELILTPPQQITKDERTQRLYGEEEQWIGPEVTNVWLLQPITVQNKSADRSS